MRLPWSRPHRERASRRGHEAGLAPVRLAGLAPASPVSRIDRHQHPHQEPARTKSRPAPRAGPHQEPNQHVAREGLDGAGAETGS